jgi:hypothetical protein
MIRLRHGRWKAWETARASLRSGYLGAVRGADNSSAFACRCNLRPETSSTIGDLVAGGMMLVLVPLSPVPVGNAAHPSSSDYRSNQSQA